MTNERPSPAPLGRPREASIDRAVLKTTRTLLRRHGYEALSIEGVAKAAGVAKTSIYRRWSTKPNLVFAAVFGSSREVEFTHTGRLARDLIQPVRALCDEFASPEARAALPALLPLFMSDGDLRGEVEQQILLPERARVRELLEAAQERGELRAHVDLELVLDQLIGTVFYRTITGASVDATLAGHIVELALAGVLKSR
jgi:AcrR family transcriptional regulator